MKKWHLVLLLILIGALAFVLTLAVGQKLGSGRESLAVEASRIVSRCRNQSYRPACYDKVIPQYMDKYSLEETMQITKLVQVLDPSYQYCHVLGHALSARETKKNPDKWKEVITRCPSGVCSNGCIHGAFQERFRAESLTRAEIAKIKPDLEDVCEPRGEWQPTGMEQASCYHAVGHLLMYVTAADHQLATGLCDEVAYKDPKHDFRQVCYDGNFMQIFQPLEPEDFALVKGKAPEDAAGHQKLCAGYNGWKYASCWNEGWPLYREQIKDPAGTEKFCSRLSGEYQDRCYNAIIYILTVQMDFDFPKLKNYCLGLPESRQGRCFAQAGSRMLETDWNNAQMAVSWCREVSDADTGGQCYQELVLQAGFTLRRGSAGSSALCRQLPEKWRDKCDQ